MPAFSNLQTIFSFVKKCVWNKQTFVTECNQNKYYEKFRCWIKSPLLIFSKYLVTGSREPVQTLLYLLLTKESIYRHSFNNFQKGLEPNSKKATDWSHEPELYSLRSNTNPTPVWRPNRKSLHDNILWTWRASLRSNMAIRPNIDIWRFKINQEFLIKGCYMEQTVFWRFDIPAIPHDHPQIYSPEGVQPRFYGRCQRLCLSCPH